MSIENLESNSKSIESQRDDELVGRVLYAVFQLIPKNLLSFLVGFVFRVKLPRPLSTWLNKGFVWAFRINMEEAALPVDAYGSIEDVFSRKLKPDARPIEHEVCMPCDGQLVVSGPAELESAVQAKGLAYSLRALVYGTRAVPADLDLAWYSTIYLAPSNYHRVHAPVSGRLLSINYIPGELWPVNPPFVKIVPNLFVKNERLVFELDLGAEGEEKAGRVFVVMVGALNVGRIESQWLPDWASNSFGRQAYEKPEFIEFQVPPRIDAGDELGAFLLGSTTVVVFDRIARDKFQLQEKGEQKVMLGKPF